jgi:hypothetical protein
MVDAESAIKGTKRFGRNEAADHAFAVIGLEAVNAHVGGRQPVPDRQQEAGDDVKAAVGKFRDGGAFVLPERGKFFDGRLAPVGMLELFTGDRLARHRPDKARARDNAAVIVHETGRVDLYGGAVRLLVDEQAARRGAQSKRFGQGERLVAGLFQDAVAAGFGACGGVGAQRAIGAGTLM